MTDHDKQIAARLKAAEQQKQNWIGIKTSFHKAVALACEGARVTLQQHGMTEADAMANIGQVLQTMAQNTAMRVNQLRPPAADVAKQQAANGNGQVDGKQGEVSRDGPST